MKKVALCKMIENFEKRKTEYLESIYQECRAKTERNWLLNNPQYISLRYFSRKVDFWPDKSEEIIVKFDFKRALIGSALFLFIQVATVAAMGKEMLTSPGFVIMILIITLISAYNCGKEIRSPVKIIMNKDGMWLHTTRSWIAWPKLISAYIRVDSSGESDTHFLVLHYYSETTDSFASTEIDLHGLNIKKERIAAEIESRK
ncbi:MAG: hypothetical protein EOO13_04430 [Chitinophagaceae bacterium]|nr:MAG: hypothetical protein EOO13_04430 [Chitinophagaceae bacterium]